MNFLDKLRGLFSSAPKDSNPVRKRTPKAYQPGKPYSRKTKYPQPNLGVGESFIASQGTIQAMVDANRYWKKKLGFEFTIRTRGGDLIITRVK